MLEIFWDSAGVTPDSGHKQTVDDSEGSGHALCHRELCSAKPMYEEPCNANSNYHWQSIGPFKVLTKRGKVEGLSSP